jgi:hypothetical protein
MATEVTAPFEIFRDTNGEPLENGQIYVGASNLEPSSNQVQIYWDAALSIPATQPIRTISGYTVRQGTPSEIFLDDSLAPYSIKVLDKNSELVYSSLQEYGTPYDVAGFINNILAAENATKSLVLNIAALKAITVASLSDDDIYQTSGYSLANDGGGGEYIWDSSDATTADDFKYIKIDDSLGGRFILRPYSNRYNALQGGVTRDSAITTTRFQAVFDAVVDGDNLYFPAPEGSNYYNLDGTIEIGDLDNIDITGPGIVDLAVAGQVSPIIYTGASVTGLEESVLRFLGMSYSQVRGFMINVDSKAEYGIWFSGANGGTMPGTITKSKRSTNCTFEESHAILATVSGVVIGYDNGFSPQTDVLNVIRVRSSTTETGAAVDSTPVSRGFEIRGLNTYVELIHCEAGGDCGYYITGNADFISCYSLNNDVCGWWNASANTLCNLTKCYMEGLVGRPIQSTTDSQPSARVWTVTNLVAFPAGGTQYPCWFRNNQPIAIIGCTMDGWITDNYAAGNEPPIYTSISNKFFTAVDYSARSDIAMISLDVSSGDTAVDIKKYFHGLRSTVIDETAGTFTLPEGSSFHNSIVSDSASGNTATLPSAIPGACHRLWRNGSGTIIAVAKAGESIMRHDTGVAATTDARLAAAAEFGFIEFNCVVATEWWPTSSLTISYT